MADQSIDVFTLGEGGVNVDANPILTADNQTLKSQNATVDPTTNRAGALVKRQGLDRFNTISLGAPVLGGIEAPVSGAGGAPSGPDGGLGPGDGGSGTRLNHLVWIGVANATGVSGAGWIATTKEFGAGGGVNIANFVQGATVIPPSPAVNQGIAFTPSNSGLALGFQDLGHAPSAFGQGANQALSGSLTDGLGARPYLNNGFPAEPGVLIYPYLTNPSGNGAVNPLTGLVITGAPNIPTIRRFNGIKDTQICAIASNAPWLASATTTLTAPCVSGSSTLTVASTATFPLHGVLQLGPANNSTLVSYTVFSSTQFNLVGLAGIGLSTGPVAAISHGMTVSSMSTRVGDPQTAYITVIDQFSTVTGTNDIGRVLKLDLTSNQYSEIFNSKNAGNNSTGALGAPYLVLGGANPAAEVSFGTLWDTTGALDQGAVWSLVTGPGSPDGFGMFGGVLSGVISDTTCAAAYGTPIQQFVGYSNNAPTPAYAILTSRNPATAAVTLQLTASGANAAQASNGFVAMAIFLGSLYVSWYNPNKDAQIYKFDGTTWTIVYTNGGTTDRVPFNLHLDQDGDVLYAFGENASNGGAYYMTSRDGSTWINRTPQMTTGSVGTQHPLNIFADFIYTTTNQN